MPSAVMDSIWSPFVSRTTSLAAALRCEAQRCGAAEHARVEVGAQVERDVRDAHLVRPRVAVDVAFLWGRPVVTHL